MRDVLRALYSEIRAYVSVLRRDGVGTDGALLRDRICHEANFFPFVPSERNATIFTSIVSDISILPDGAIHAIVLYYAQVDAIEAMIGDLRSLDLARIGPSRAAELYIIFTQLKIEAAELGADALNDIAAYLDYSTAPEATGIAEWAVTERAALSSRQASDR